MNYAEMSDYQINCEVAKAMGLIVVTSKCDIGNYVGVAREGEADFTYVDYCNNPADMWPLIVENEISILAGKEGSSLAFHGVKEDAYYNPCGYDFYFSCKNALRAAAIVYLMMTEKGE